MKKFICLIWTFILIVSLTACRKENITPMLLSDAKLKEQEEEIIELLKFDGSAHIFDFKVDENVKKVSISSYELDENGQWKIIGGGGDHSLFGKKGRIAISFDIIANGMKVSIQDEESTGSTKHTIPEKIDTSGMSVATAFANDPTEIVYEKEVPIAVQIVTSKDDVTSYDIEYFFKPQEYKKIGYEHVYAVTVKFSQEELS